MGQVFLVEDLNRDNLQLALKTLLSKEVEANFLKQFAVEFSELAKLSHPNIAKAYDYGVIANTKERFFTTEFVKAVELGQAARETTVEQKIDLVAQFLRGLQFLSDKVDFLLHGSFFRSILKIYQQEEVSLDLEEYLAVI